MAAKSTMDQNHHCRFCEIKFHKASTAAIHMCVKKRRHMDINSAGSRFGFRVFQRFYELTMKTKKLKSIDDFINSSYYIDFVKFGNYLALLKPIHPDRYIDFVLMNGVKLKDWTKDFVYDTYIESFIKKEPALDATERTITEIIDWCEKNNGNFGNFFCEISVHEASYLIKTGRISPWVLYLANSGSNLESRFTEDHMNIIGNIIDPGFWMRKFKKFDEDVTYIKTLLKQSGL